MKLNPFDFCLNIFLLSVLAVFSFSDKSKEDKGPIIPQTNTIVVTRQQIDKMSLEQSSKFAETLRRKLNTDYEISFDVNEVKVIQTEKSVREIYFKPSSFVPTDYYHEKLKEFCPKFFSLINDEISKSDQIKEIIIQGHTSPEWEGERSTWRSYKRNLELSQDRARNVFILCFEIALEENPNLLQSKIPNISTSTGYSFAKVRYTNGKIDDEKSRRVEFVVKLNLQ
jgi:outer membrane protein OmpA-like peptidoglycan-associated protein